ncbi:hypothetical protein EDD17DRAFT_1881402, partial [Pisolithus thermaeus]
MTTSELTKYTESPPKCIFVVGVQRHAAWVVLQTYSIVSTEGIVPTTLSTAPFCCHEDLLAMSRQNLEDVQTVNEKLPRRMRIGVAVEREDHWVADNDEDIKGAIAGMSDAEIRRRIEVLV